MKRRQRQLELGLVALGLTSLALLLLCLMIGFWEAAKAQGNSLSSAPHTPKDQRPDISHCFEPDETRELWDCIRHEEVTSLVTEEE